MTRCKYINGHKSGYLPLYLILFIWMKSSI